MPVSITGTEGDGVLFNGDFFELRGQKHHACVISLVGRENVRSVTEKQVGDLFLLEKGNDGGKSLRSLGGKAVGGDISCNKKTFVYLEAMGRLGDEAKDLEMWYSQVMEDNTEKIAAVKAIFEQLGVREACEAVVAQYTQSALDILESLPQNAATEQLRQLANKLNTRKE